MRRDPQQLWHLSARGRKVRWFDYVTFLPVYLFVLAFSPLLGDHHPWRHRAMTLRSWAHRGTHLSEQFGIVFWACGINILILLYCFFFRG